MISGATGVNEITFVTVTKENVFNLALTIR